ASYLALTGHFHPQKSSNPPAVPSDHPTYGAVLKRVRPTGSFPYDAVHVNGPVLVPETVAPGQDAGFLGSEFDPLLLGDVNAMPVAVPGLDARPELPFHRLEARRSLKSALEEVCRERDHGRKLADRHPHQMAQAYEQAYALLASERTRRAFDLS